MECCVREESRPLAGETAELDECGGSRSQKAGCAHNPQAPLYRDPADANLQQTAATPFKFKPDRANLDARPDQCDGRLHCPKHCSMVWLHGGTGSVREERRLGCKGSRGREIGRERWCRDIGEGGGGRGESGRGEWEWKRGRKGARVWKKGRKQGSEDGWREGSKDQEEGYREKKGVSERGIAEDVGRLTCRTRR